MAKQKIEKSYDRDYGPVVLWLDDIKEIYERLKATASDVEISNKDYKFDNLESVINYFDGHTQYQMVVSASKPYVRYSCHRHGSSLRVGSGPSSAELFLELDEIIGRRQRKPKWAYSWWIMLVLMALGPLQFLFLEDTARRLGILAIQLILFAWFMRAMFIGLRRGSVIHMVKRSEAPDFLKRNKDQLLMMVISALVGGILTFAGTQLKDKFFSASSTIAPP
jgi:hypothetical protein